jgi:CheY-like chemotaxis protein
MALASARWFAGFRHRWTLRDGVPDVSQTTRTNTNGPSPWQLFGTGVRIVTAAARPRAHIDRPWLALVVDRDRDTRSLYREYFRFLRYDVDVAEDGLHALAKALARTPDIITMETRLAGIDGYDLCEILKHHRKTVDIPIVMVTADAFAADVARATRAGADSVLIKPCMLETLAAELYRLLVGRLARARA